jgi:hypothetical protein
VLALALMVLALASMVLAKLTLDLHKHYLLVPVLAAQLHQPFLL